MSNVIKLERQIKQTNTVLQVVRKQSKTFWKYVGLLNQDKAMAENEIKGLCVALNGTKKVNLTEDNRLTLHLMIRRKVERPITKEQAKFGLKWLKTKAFKLNGDSRKNCILGVREQEIVKNFSHFKFAGVCSTNDAGYYGPYSRYVPIWRTYAKDGRYFDYIVVSSGLFKQFEIIG